MHSIRSITQNIVVVDASVVGVVVGTSVVVVVSCALVVVVSSCVIVVVVAGSCVVGVETGICKDTFGYNVGVASVDNAASLKLMELYWGCGERGGGVKHF